MTKEAVLAEFGGQQFSAFKPALADLAVSKIGPITQEMRRLVADPGYIDQVLGDGAARAAAIADPILDDVRKILGFVASRPR